MWPAVPVWVQAAISSYDAALRLRWSELARQFILDRRIRNAPPGSYDALMVTLDRRKTRLRDHEVRLMRALEEKPNRTERRVYKDTLARVIHGRIDAGVRLESLQSGYLFVYWVPAPTADESWDFRLTCILYTLRTNDIWTAGGADEVHEQMMTADRSEEVKLAARRADDVRHGARHVYQDEQRRRGERVLVGANLRPAGPLILPEGQHGTDRQ
jgi:hypothetical protein